MRLAVCTLSAVLLSGCSWFGMGSSNSNNNGYSYGGNYGCAPTQTAYAGHSYQGWQGNGCAPAGAYAASGQGYGTGMNGYGAHTQGYDQGQMGGMGLRGPQQQQIGGYGYSSGGAYASHGYDAGAGTMLGPNTPYGSAVGGQYAPAGGGNVQTIQGAPIYVPQPYQANYGAAGGAGAYGYGGGYGYNGAGGAYGYGGNACCGGGAALPFGIEAGIGTDLSIGGDVFPGEIAKPALPGPGTVSALVPVSYKDAFGNAVNYDLAATYDLSPNTTILGRVGYSKADGEILSVGTVDDGAGLTEELFAEFSDLEQYTIEGGVRQYMGGWNNGQSGIRPYVAASAGFGYNESVNVTQSSATLVDPAFFTQEYIEEGWVPTAAGAIGAEMQVGARTAIGVEAGIRWRDDMNTNFESDDRWSVPLRLRGRVSF